jgi:hypothetical protein
VYPTDSSQVGSREPRPDASTTRSAFRVLPLFRRTPARNGIDIQAIPFSVLLFTVGVESVAALQAHACETNNYAIR